MFLFRNSLQVTLNSYKGREKFRKDSSTMSTIQTSYNVKHSTNLHPGHKAHKAKQHQNPLALIHQYQAKLNQAKPYNQAKTGEYTLGTNPLTGDIVLGKKDIMGFYGVAFKPDGSVVENRAPANGGPQQVLPAGSVDFGALQGLLQEKNALDAEINSLKAGVQSKQKGVVVPQDLNSLLVAQGNLASQLAELKALTGGQLNLIA